LIAQHIETSSKQDGEEKVKTAPEQIEDNN